MKCISVYTKDFSAFSDIYEKVLDTPLTEDEETVVDGIEVSESGIVPTEYLQRMQSKKEVVVMKVKERDITILQHGDLFEIFLPEAQTAAH